MAWEDKRQSMRLRVKYQFRQDPTDDCRRVVFEFRNRFLSGRK